MKTRTCRAIASGLLIAALLPVTAAHAQLGDLLKGGGTSGGTAGSLGTLGSALSGQSLSSGSLGNVAGVLEYCIKNNYLGGDAASVKDKLLARITGQKQQETGFANGAKGLLKGGDGKSLNFKMLSSKVKEKACDYVLKNATSLI